MPQRQPYRPFDDVSQRWRDLAERRRTHFVELYRSGRWKHYYTEEQFLVRLREAVHAADAWARIAPPKSELSQAAE